MHTVPEASGYKQMAHSTGPLSYFESFTCVLSPVVKVDAGGGVRRSSGVTVLLVPRFAVSGLAGAPTIVGNLTLGAGLEGDAVLAVGGEAVSAFFASGAEVPLSFLVVWSPMVPVLFFF